MPTCPDCNGAKKKQALVNHGEEAGCAFEVVDCWTCAGLGTITGQRVEWMQRGNAMRADRLARGETMVEAAKRLGIHWRDINEMEHGRIEPLPIEVPHG